MPFPNNRLQKKELILEVYTEVGKIMILQTMNRGQVFTEIDTKNWEAGIYFMYLCCDFKRNSLK